MPGAIGCYAPTTNLETPTRNMQNMKHEHVGQPANNVRRPPASTCCPCFTSVVGGNSVLKMCVYARCFVQCYKAYWTEIIRNLTIRQQIGLEETIIKEIEQNQLAWYGHVQSMAEERLPKIALKVDAETKESTRKTKEKLDGRCKEGHEQKKPK